MIKTLYFDVETTGTDPSKHGLIQLACLVDIDGTIVDEGNWFIQPFEKDMIDEGALKVNGLSLEKMKGFEFMKPRDVYFQIITLFGKHVDKFNRSDKFWPAGYNCGFDLEFLRVFFEKNDDSYFGSWQNWRAIDPLPLIRYLGWLGKVDLPDYRLATVCNYLNVQLGAAHDALADVRATRECILELKSLIKIG